ncbi:hypothetical protein DWV16_11070 [Anaerotruncus sp. AF02-27]|jgi:glyoxylate reductase|uniref:NAD(P)-dependent oxidoreductase n=1 Tax=Anaerotruncus TaxID=244127 RepID=UPI000E469DAE|nr:MULTISPECIES: NAD(P)-dependent oxidoreductase [Anaerotruncus]RGX54927.1 hypothetical protein DWV16_11070 [Anaerotruncus sp. AF02-27]
MKKILLTHRIPDECVSPLQKEFEIVMPADKAAFSTRELEEQIVDASALVVVNCDARRPLLEKAGPAFQAAGTISVGYDSIDWAYCTEQGYAVVNTPTSLTHATSEIAIGLMLSAMRNITRLDRELRKTLTWTTDSFFPKGTVSPNGKTLGVIGFGRIGKCVAQKMKTFGMNIQYFDVVRASAQIEAEYEAKFVSLEDLLKTSDVVTLHCPYSNQFHHMMNEKTFALMKPDAYFINAARGKLVDEQALIAALKSHVIAGAGIDVYENEPYPIPELAQLENLVMTPHIGSMAYEVRVQMGLECLNGIAGVLRGGIPYNVVNREVLQK